MQKLVQKTEGYIQIPVEIFQYARKNPEILLVYASLLRYTDFGKPIYLEPKRIVADLLISNYLLRKALKKLSAGGWIKYGKGPKSTVLEVTVYEKPIK